MTTYVLDTSVLMAAPDAITKFAEHRVVVPIVVIEELEKNRTKPGEPGFAAREAIRLIDRIAAEHATITEPAVVNDDGGTFEVRLNDISRKRLPHALQADTNDHRILSVAAEAASTGEEVVLVTKDAPLRVKAKVCPGFDAEDYRNDKTADNGWSGIASVDVFTEFIDSLYQHSDGIPLGTAPAEIAALPLNTGLLLDSGSSGALARITGDKRVVPVYDDAVRIGKLMPRNAEQKLAAAMLLDPTIDIVSVSGPAGTGKTLVATAAGLQRRDNNGVHSRTHVIRPMDALGGQEMGFLPGDAGAKVAPWAAAVYDALEAVYSRTEIDRFFETGALVVEPLTYLRGRTLRGTVVIDEAQNLEQRTLLAALTRAGGDPRSKEPATKIVLCWSPDQIDNGRASLEAGVAGLRTRLAGHPHYAHISLTTPERSRVAKMIAEAYPSYS